MSDNNWNEEGWETEEAAKATGTANEGDKEIDIDVKPVNLPKRIVMIVLIVLCVGIAVITIIGSSMSIEKEVNPADSQDVYNSGVTDHIESTPEGGESNSNFSENSAILESSVSTGIDSVSSGDSAENTGNQESDANQKPIEDVTSNVVQAPAEFVGVIEPELGDFVSTTGIVLSKQVFKRNQNYFYNLQISMVYGDLAQTVDYFCPKSTYDAVDSGYVLNVTYQVDSVGNFSIYSITDG